MLWSGTDTTTLSDRSRALPDVPAQSISFSPHLPCGQGHDDAQIWLIPACRGKLLQAGSSQRKHSIDTRASVTVRKRCPKANRRMLHERVALSSGDALIVGGSAVNAAFSGSGAVSAAELFGPAAETFAVMPAMAVPRTYHRVAVRLPDARVAAPAARSREPRLPSCTRCCPARASGVGVRCLSAWMRWVTMRPACNGG